MRNLQNVRVKVSSSYEKICPFPVGYIYLSTNSTSPASTYGGNWSALTDSRFLRPAGSWNDTGGESTHVLTVAEMPAHQHEQVVGNPSADTSKNVGVRVDYNYDAPCASYPQALYVMPTGSGKAHNNLPPYRNCYAWYRTS